MRQQDVTSRSELKEEIKKLELTDVGDSRHHSAYSRLIDLLNKFINAHENGCHSYLFVLLATDAVSIHGRTLAPLLREILDQYIECKKSGKITRDTAFAAFYTLGVYYARQYAREELHALVIGNKIYGDCFIKTYPLYFDLLVRYYGIAGIYDRQLLMAKIGERRYRRFMKAHSIGEYNMCFKAGYIDAVCSYTQYLYVYDRLHLQSDFVAMGETDAPGGRDVRHLNTIEALMSLDACHPLGCDDLENAEKYTQDAIDFNPGYPKYYYFRARVYFFKCVIRGVAPDMDCVIEDVQNAIEREGPAVDRRRRIATYEGFRDLANDHCRMVPTSREMERRKHDIICCTEQPKHDDKNRPPVTCREGSKEDYVFISYCSADFKSVYIDLLEMGRRGVRFWYDAAIDAGKNWNPVAMEKLRGAACVILYLSNNAMLSAGVRQELEAARGNKKIYCISLTGEGRISDSIKNMIRNKSAGELDAAGITLLLDAFSDDVTSIVRSNDAMMTVHLERVYEALFNDFPNTMSICKSEGDTRENDAKGDTRHINEDAFYRSNVERVWVVADGITRDKKDEYRARPDFSISRVVSEVFSDAVGRGMEEDIGTCYNLDDVKVSLRNRFRLANELVGKLLHNPTESTDDRVLEALEKYGDLSYDSVNNPEIPGCVCLVGVLYRDKFVYGAAGDCMGFLVRDDQVMVFSQKQTTYAYEVEKCERDRVQLITQFVNQSEYEYNYGVVNGSENAKECFRISHIDLRQGDVLYLATDGISDYLQFARSTDLNEKTLKEIFDASDALDEKMGKSYRDDRTLIRIRIGSNL